MKRQPFHSCLVAKNTAFAALAARVNGKHRQFAATTFEHMHSEGIYRGALAGTGHTGDTYTHRVAGKGKTTFYDFLSNSLMLGQNALDKSHRPAKHRDVATQNALDIVIDRQ